LAAVKGLAAAQCLKGFPVEPYSQERKEEEGTENEVYF
jgi:hypothetical protein